MWARRMLGWSTFLVGPAIAACLGFLTLVEGELRLNGDSVIVRLKLASLLRAYSRPIAILVMLLGVFFFAAMSGHLIADSLIGGDCGR